MKLYRVSVSVVDIIMHISSEAYKSWCFTMPMLFWLEQKNTSDQYKENISLDTTTHHYIAASAECATVAW